MRICSYNCLPGRHESLLRQKCVLDACLSRIIKMLNAETLCKSPANLTVLRTLDVLIRSEMVHHKRDPGSIRNLLKASFFILKNRNRSRDIIGHHEVKIHRDQLSGFHFLKTGMLRHDLLCHCHSHRESSLSVL